MAHQQCYVRARVDEGLVPHPRVAPRLEFGVLLVVGRVVRLEDQLEVVPCVGDLFNVARLQKVHPRHPLDLYPEGFQKLSDAARVLAGSDAKLAVDFESFRSERVFHYTAGNVAVFDAVQVAVEPADIGVPQRDLLHSSLHTGAHVDLHPVAHLVLAVGQNDGPAHKVFEDVGQRERQREPEGGSDEDQQSRVASLLYHDDDRGHEEGGSKNRA
mmetsp:Transcript_31698/g.53263  ORF Transcript_31698/g.53263 Transcript_31698/m.53263 type:complete len:214 (+) Transcript_31698:1175-1816(+)